MAFPLFNNLIDFNIDDSLVSFSTEYSAQLVNEPAFLEQYRKVVPFIKVDEVLHDDIQASIQFLKDVDIEIEELFLNTYGLK